MDAVKFDVAAGTVQGGCDPRFRLVADEFVRNFQERNEVGASVCLTYQGETVVDLWGGIARPADNTPWERDTVCVVFSCTKGATAICAHILAARGLLDIEAPVAGYWPEFAQGAKAGVTVRMMLDHSAGVPALRENLRPDGVHDWDYMVGRLEAEEPWWKPGTRNGYHLLTFGWTVGELVRRVSGKSLGTFFQDEVARPLGIDFWIGAPESTGDRIAPSLDLFARQPDDPLDDFQIAMASDPASLQGRAFLGEGGFNPNSRESHAAEIGAAGGISNGRGLAGMYAPFACGGSLDSAAILTRSAFVRAHACECGTRALSGQAASTAGARWARVPRLPSTRWAATPNNCS